MITRTLSHWKAAVAAALMAVLALAVPAAASVPATIGPYRVEVATDPAVIAVGQARLLVRLTDAGGAPVSGARVSTLVKMPTMDMGEVERPAAPVADRPGVYEAPAAFMMAGDFEATLKIDGPQGPATGVVKLNTGQDTGGLPAPSAGTTGGPSGGPNPILGLLPWIAGLAVAAFVVMRMRRTGQRLEWRQAANWRVLAGVAVLVAMVLVARYAVDHWRRPGSMTPIEAQAMEMDTPAPPGSAPVDLATVSMGPVDSTVRYTGQAVGYVEQDVSPRVRGWIVWMPFYVGDHVRKGQVVARLDTSEIQPQIEERQAAASMARQGADVARTEYQQALAAVGQARAEATGRRGGLLDARASLTAAQEDRAGAQAALASAQSGLADAEAQLDAAEADNDYWKAQLERSRALLKAGAVSGEEFQRDQSAAAGAAAKVRQARAAIAKVQADIRGAQSAQRKADAMIASANARLSQSAAEIAAGEAQVRSAQAAADASRQRIAQAESGVAQARASAAQSATQRGYSEIRSEADGVITQRLISPGTLVSPGQAILRVAQVSPIRLQANVAEADLARIRPGSPVRITSQAGGQPLSAKITSVAPGVDPSARTGVAEAVVANRDGRFLPGQYVVMSITVGRRSAALRVPSGAIQQRPGGQPFVWVAEPSGAAFTVHQRSVTTGLDNGDTVEVRGGLKEGMRVVAFGAQNLNEGDTVTAAGAQTARSAPAPSTGMPGMPGM